MAVSKSSFLGGKLQTTLATHYLKSQGAREGVPSSVKCRGSVWFHSDLCGASRQGACNMPVCRLAVNTLYQYWPVELDRSAALLNFWVEIGQFPS